MKAARLTLIALAAGALAVAGCGGSDDEQQGGANTGGGATTSEDQASSGGGGETVKISEVDFKIKPANPSVEPGTVTFEISNDGKAPHALEVEGPAGEVETDTIAAGESTTLEVDLSEPGSYVMYCPVGNHREQGMEGEVRVGGGGGGSGSSEDNSGSGGSGY